MIKYAFFDLDNTLFDARWREFYKPSIVNTHQAWDHYDSLLDQDDLIVPVAELYYQVHNKSPTRELSPVLFTGRREKWREKTTMKLESSGLLHVGPLLMRPDDDSSPQPILKIGLVRDFLRFVDDNRSIKDAVSMVVDDRQDVCEAFNALGVATLCVSLGR